MEEYLLTREELLNLLKDSIELNILYACGIDNTSAYEQKYEVLRDLHDVDSFKEAAESILSEMAYKRITCENEKDCEK